MDLDRPLLGFTCTRREKCKKTNQITALDGLQPDVRRKTKKSGQLNSDVYENVNFRPNKQPHCTASLASRADGALACPCSKTSCKELYQSFQDHQSCTKLQRFLFQQPIVSRPFLLIHLQIFSKSSTTNLALCRYSQVHLEIIVTLGYLSRAEQLQ